MRRLWGVGKVTESRLVKAGFKTIGNIQDASMEDLAAILGNQGAVLKRLSFGVDDRPVEAEREIKSIGDESTYEMDISDPSVIDREIAIHSDVVAQRLRKHNLTARTVTLKIRFASFRTVTRSLSFEEGTSLQEEIYGYAAELLRKIPLTEGVRLIGVTASRLGPPLSMASLFSENRDKRNRAAAAMDEIQARFGRKALQKGFWLEEKK